MLTGLYAHNHGVTANLAPEGGEPRFRELGLDGDTVASRLNAASYEIAYFGKYLNDYEGHFLGEHRLQDKKAPTPSPPASRCSRVVRAYREAWSRRHSSPTRTSPPTLNDSAGAETGADGRSLAPLLENPSSPGCDAVLLEGWAKGTIPGYQAVRAREHLYVEYETGERELYDPEADPYQQQNFYETADPALLSELESKLNALRGCANDACRRAEWGKTGRKRPSVSPDAGRRGLRAEQEQNREARHEGQGQKKRPTLEHLSSPSHTRRGAADARPRVRPCEYSAFYVIARCGM
jgi:hypothetical protein